MLLRRAPGPLDFPTVPHGVITLQEQLHAAQRRLTELQSLPAGPHGSLSAMALKNERLVAQVARLEALLKVPPAAAPRSQPPCHAGRSGPTDGMCA